MSKPNNKISLRRSTRNVQKSKRKPVYVPQKRSLRPRRTQKCKINLRKRVKKLSYREIPDDVLKKLNPLAVFEFNDSDYEYESESSSTNDEDNSMRSVVKKLQQDYKKQPRIEILEAIKSKHDKIVAKPVQKPYGITILTHDKAKTETTLVQNKNNFDLDPEEEEEDEVDVVEPAISNDSIQIHVYESASESTKSNTAEPQIIIDALDIPEIVDDPEVQIEPDNNDPVITKWRNKAERKKFETSKHEIINLNNSIVPNPFANKKKIKSKINNKNIIEVKIDKSSDKSDSEIIIDKNVENKKLIDDLTQSFAEDNTRNKLKIISDVVVRPADKEIPKFAKPWRMHVYDKKQPYTFTYKNKSFTPRYEPDYNYKLTTDNKVKTKETKKPVYQTSITNFLKGEKPEIINNNELFTDPQKQPKSPRKALIEINFIQSTPVKTSHNTTINIPHDISRIADSPIPFEKTNLFEQIKSSPIRKKTSPIIPQKEIDVTDDNMTLNEIPLFQEPEDYQEVKKPKKPVRKYQKRKRVPSFEVNIEDSDTDVEIDVVTVEEPQKKKKFQRTKEEDLEADRLANAYNSMFAEIEKHELVID